MIVAIVGSRKYEFPDRIEEEIKNLRSQHQGDLVIISGGASKGADKHAKDISLKLGIQYSEYNPAHTVKNKHSAMPDDFYGKPYRVSQYHERNELIAENCELMMAFIPSGIESKGTESAIRSARKLGKKVIVIS
jgi:hypothetical protein